jgi:ketosteroid isomerase-like protein
MRSVNKSMLSGIAVATLIASSAVPAFAVDERAVISTANSQFYAAINKLFTGDINPMTSIWSHADDVTYMGPTGGYERGWTAVLKNWQGQASLKLGGKVEPADIQIIAGKDMAVVSDIEVGENSNAGGRVEKVRLRATNIYRKESGQWKMVGHHTDPLPYLTK